MVSMAPAVLFSCWRGRFTTINAYGFGKFCESPVPGRLKVLLVVHLVLSIAPVTIFLLPGGLLWLPVIWALSGISLAEVMLLGVWAGLGSPTGARRWFAMLAGAAYIAAWPALLHAISLHSVEPFITNYAWLAPLYAALAMLATGVLLLVRHRFAEVLRLCDDAIPPSARRQFTVLHVLIATTIVGMLLGLSRASVGADAGGAWLSAIGYLMMIVVCGINLAMCVWATLPPGHVLWRVLLVLVVAILLGMVSSYTLLYRLKTPEWRWWLFFAQALSYAIPPVIVVVSLLVVRSAGYRLVPNSVAAALRRSA